jgi:Ulp1 family protease
METLMPNNDLNDNIVNLFLSLLLEHMLGSELKAKSHFFNTYFMSYLIGSR